MLVKSRRSRIHTLQVQRRIWSKIETTLDYSTVELNYRQKYHLIQIDGSTSFFLHMEKIFQNIGSFIVIQLVVSRRSSARN